MFGLEMPELVIIIVAFAVLFGSDKIGKFARSLGRFGGEFKKGQLELKNEMDDIRAEVGSIDKRKRT